MSLKLISNKGISQRPIVVEIINLIKENPNDFIYLARIFSVYSTNKEELLDEIKNQIDLTLRLAFMPEDRKNKLESILVQVYEDKRFDRIRAEILENMVYEYGPFTESITCEKRYIEPMIKDKEILVGGSNIKCDLVFYKDNSSPLEFVECKTNISNVIPWDLPFEKMKKSHQDKLKYLASAHEYLKSHYCEPKVYLACFNEDYTRELKNLHDNLEYPFIHMINPTEIVSGKTR